jgi:GNAT superfamily N-acetyltransferase
MSVATPVVAMGSDDVTIELAQSPHGDAGECARIFVEARRKAFHWVDHQLFQLEDFRTQTRGEEVWIARHAGRVVGFASLWLFSGSSFLHHLFVDPGAQRRGIGTLLLERSLQRLSRPATLKCLEANTPARAFYEKHGWKSAERSESSLGPCLLYWKDD